MITFTVNITKGWRADPRRLKAVQRYAMKRWSLSWGARNIHAAKIWFNAAERASRIHRVVTG